MLATTYTPPVRFASLVLVDPILARPPRAGEPDMDLSGAILRRRDVWPSRAALAASLRASRAYARWDRRVLEVYIVSRSRFIFSWWRQGWDRDDVLMGARCLCREMGLGTSRVRCTRTSVA